MTRQRKLCGAKTKSTGEPCRRTAGWGTDHPGEGRCKLHGGKSKCGPEHPRYKTGLYADVFKGRLREKLRQAHALPDPTNVLDEIAVARVMFAEYIESSLGDTVTHEMADNIQVMAGRIVTMATRFIKARAAMEFSTMEYRHILDVMKQALDEFIPDEDEQNRFIDIISTRISG